MAAKGHKQEHEYGIGAVAKLTGLTDHAIRVWERRYGAVVARRASNGRRVYGPADVEKLRLLKSLTDRGVSIGQIAGDTVDALRERVRNMSEIVGAAIPDHVGVAVLGDLLPGLFADHARDIAPVQVLLADSNRDTFVADLAGRGVDVVVVECPVLDSSVIGQLQAYMEQAGASKGVLVYNFGRSRDIDMASDSDLVVLRSPVNVDGVRAAVMRAYTPAAPARPQAPQPETEESGWRVSGPIPPRLFNHQQLTRLTRASTAIDCECPHHLAQLVGDLTAFEVYSAQCANRDEDDAELHRYLHQTTAQARALIEVALRRVAQAEGIDY
jgi:MerR family transcriptional regulator, light-induced transcriptional regulator